MSQNPYLQIEKGGNSLELQTYWYFCLSQSGRYVQILRYVHVSKVVSVLHTPNPQPIDVVNRQRTGQLYLDVFALVPVQWFQRVHLVRNLNETAVTPKLSNRELFYLDAVSVRFRSVPNPEVSVRPSTVVMQVRYVKRLRVQYADVVRS